MMKKKKQSFLDTLSEKLTFYIGTNASIVVHTILFIGIFSLRFFKVSTEEILLILTTAVSLEAIYLAIFIQMTVNRTTESLASVEEDIDDLQEDVGDIQEDVQEISEDYLEDETEEVDVVKVLKDMEERLKDLQRDIMALESKRKSI